MILGDSSKDIGQIFQYGRIQGIANVGSVQSQDGNAFLRPFIDDQNAHLAERIKGNDGLGVFDTGDRVNLFVDKMADIAVIGDVKFGH